MRKAERRKKVRGREGGGLKVGRRMEKKTERGRKTLKNVEKKTEIKIEM